VPGLYPLAAPASDHLYPDGHCNVVPSGSADRSSSLENTLSRSAFTNFIEVSLLNRATWALVRSTSHVDAVTWWSVKNNYMDNLIPLQCSMHFIISFILTWKHGIQPSQYNVTQLRHTIIDSLLISLSLSLSFFFIICLFLFLIFSLFHYLYFPVCIAFVNYILYLLLTITIVTIMLY